MKQTAVEWLESIIKHCERFGTNIEQIDIEHAKEIEKEQIENSFNYGQFDLGMEADEYYNQTFKSE